MILAVAPLFYIFIQFLTPNYQVNQVIIEVALITHVGLEGCGKPSDHMI